MSGGDAFWRSFTIRACRYAEVSTGKQKNTEAQLQFFKDNWRDLARSMHLWIVCYSCEVPCRRSHVNEDRECLKCSHCEKLIYCGRDFCKRPEKCPDCDTLYFFLGCMDLS